MTPHDFVQPGACEPMKGLVHAATSGLFAAMAVYNAAAWWYRGDDRNLYLACIYAGGAAFEHRQARGHFGACRD